MLSVSELYIYPIKSLGGIAISSAVITDRGFQHDRRWMLVDENNIFITQREINSMALLQVGLTEDSLLVTHKLNQHSISIPFNAETKEATVVQVWKDICPAIFVSSIADEWFSDMLSVKCRLVYMPDLSIREVDKKYAVHNEITSFSDGYPILMIGQSTLEELNGRLEEPLPMNRFRPNIVFTGGEPFEEDGMEDFIINGVEFFGVKLCARCPIPTINQDNAERAKEPLKTLARYRMRNNNIYFGQNLLYKGTGVINIGDTISVKKKKQSVISLSDESI